MSQHSAASMARERFRSPSAPPSIPVQRPPAVYISVHGRTGDPSIGDRADGSAKAIMQMAVPVVPTVCFGAKARLRRVGSHPERQP